MKKYKFAESNIKQLLTYEAQVIPEVDATRMATHPFLQLKEFDRIVWNFPFALIQTNVSDQSKIRIHKVLMDLFFMNSSRMLKPKAEVHVTKKVTYPYDRWGLKEIANRISLRFLEDVCFKRVITPGIIIAGPQRKTHMNRSTLVERVPTNSYSTKWFMSL